MLSFSSILHNSFNVPQFSVSRCLSNEIFSRSIFYVFFPSINIQLSFQNSFEVAKKVEVFNWDSWYAVHTPHFFVLLKLFIDYAFGEAPCFSLKITPSLAAAIFIKSLSSTFLFLEAPVLTFVFAITAFSFFVIFLISFFGETLILLSFSTQYRDEQTYLYFKYWWQLVLPMTLHRYFVGSY